MKCPNCKITVKSYYAYCPNCGAGLYANQKRRPGSLLSVILVLILCFAGGYLYLHRFGIQHEDPLHINTRENKAADASEDKGPFSRFLYPIPESSSQSIPLSVGTVIINDIAGNRLATIPGAVTDSGWLAIPAKFCVGGYDWRFRDSDNGESEIIGGIIGDQDTVGIWQIKAINRFPGRQLYPAKFDTPMTWVSIVSSQKIEPVKPAILSEQQNLYHVLLPETIKEPGVLMQEGRIVGWSFGDLIDGGYLWKGVDETSLVYELSVTDFYRLTFQNSREEQFIIAYSKETQNPVHQLEKFANGFRLDAIRLDHNLSPQLKSEVVISKMHSTLSQLIYAGNIDDVPAFFDSSVLSEAADVPLLTQVSEIIIKARGPEIAIDVIEEVLHDPENFDDRQIRRIKEFLKKPYEQWLTTLISNKDYSNAIQAFNRAQLFLGHEPQIQLNGVRLALAFDDWEAADRMLSTFAFPLELAGQVNILKEQISDLKGRENTIIVRFSPGTGQIPVTAILNRKINQNFVIDTGATTVTIPTDTAKKLRLNYDGAAPIRKLNTAGGVVEAPQVTIDAIELGGWTEYNVAAFILDIPNQPGLGLLGLNYLNRFRMNLNTKSGVLTLGPR